MAKDFLTEPPNDIQIQQDAAPTDDRQNREPVRIVVVGSRLRHNRRSKLAGATRFCPNGRLERLAACTEYGPVDARADKMVAEELRQLTIRAIAFHKPNVWESCDRPSSSIDLLIQSK